MISDIDAILNPKLWDGLTPEECGVRDAKAAFEEIRPILRGALPETRRKLKGKVA